MSLCNYIAENKIKTVIHVVGVVVWAVISVFGSLKVLPRYQIHHEHRGVIIMFYFIYGFIVSVLAALLVGGVLVLVNRCIRESHAHQTSGKNKEENV